MEMITDSIMYGPMDRRASFMEIYLKGAKPSVQVSTGCWGAFGVSEMAALFSCL